MKRLVIFRSAPGAVGVAVAHAVALSPIVERVERGTPIVGAHPRGVLDAPREPGDRRDRGRTPRSFPGVNSPASMVGPLGPAAARP